MAIRLKYLRFTEESNALDYLEKSARYIKETDKDLLAWKWVILSLHGALYGFAICACQGTNYENVTTKNKKGESKLITLDKALELCQDTNYMKMLVNSQPLVLNENQRDSIRRLKRELRNKIEHYVPSGRSIEIHGLPFITIDVLDVIKFLALETRTYIHIKQAQMKRIKSLVFQSKKFLIKTKLYQEAIRAQGSITHLSKVQKRKKH
jgi:hypothetical protein